MSDFGVASPAADLDMAELCAWPLPELLPVGFGGKGKRGLRCRFKRGMRNRLVPDTPSRGEAERGLLSPALRSEREDSEKRASVTEER